MAEAAAPRPGRLLFIAAAFPPYRAPEADHALRECLELARRGFEVHVLTTDRGDVARPPELQVHALMGSWSWGELGKVWRLGARCVRTLGLRSSTSSDTCTATTR